MEKTSIMTSETMMTNEEVLVKAMRGDENIVIPMNVKAEDKVEAFDPDDDILAGKTREELLQELGKDGVKSEEVTGTVAVDEITGEQSMANPLTENTVEDIKSLRDFDTESLTKQMTEMSKQHARLILPFNFTDKQVDAFIQKLEEYLPTVNDDDIKRMTSDQVKNFVGDEIYMHVKMIDKHPSASIKNFLISNKSSMSEKKRLIDVSKELDVVMTFLKNKPLAEIHAEINATMDAEPNAYPTEYHRAVEFLKRYIAFIQGNDEIKDNSHMLDEIATAQQKIDAITDALNFTTIQSQLMLMKPHLKTAFKDPKKIDSTVLNFIGFLNADDTMNISFPVPKNFNKNAGDEVVLQLTTIWLIFVELIMMYKLLPEMSELSYVEYYDMAMLLMKPTEPTEDEPDNIKAVRGLIAQYNVTAEHIKTAKNTAILVTYVIAQVFKPKRLNTHRKYVLSYTMNIITRSMNKNFLNISHGLIDTILKILE